MKDKVKKAQEFAIEKHEGQKDDYGLDYFLNHCLKVGQIIDKLCPRDENLICAALLHDTIEDTATTYKELIQEFNQDIADLVMEVTHEGKKDNIGYYFPRLKSKRGIILKFADRLVNLTRMDCWETKRQEHYLKKSKFWKDTPDET